MPERGSVITGRLWIMRASKYLREIKLAACLTACLPAWSQRTQAEGSEAKTHGKIRREVGVESGYE